MPGREPSLEGGGDTGVFGAPNAAPTSESGREGTTRSSEEPLVYTGMLLGVAGRLPPSSRTDTAESVEERRALVDRASSLVGGSTVVSGTLPLLPELVSSDRPLSTPSIFLGSWGGAELLEVTDLARDRWSPESPFSRVRYRFRRESMSGSAGERESQGGDIAWVLGL